MIKEDNFLKDLKKNRNAKKFIASQTELRANVARIIGQPGRTIQEDKEKVTQNNMLLNRQWFY